MFLKIVAINDLYKFCKQVVASVKQKIGQIVGQIIGLTILIRMCI